MQAGQEVRFRRWTDGRIRSELAAFWATTGRLPRTSDVASPHWHGPSARTLARRFGGVAGAWRALGPVPDFDGASALWAAAGPATELALVGALADLIRPRWSRPGTERRTGAGPPDTREPGGP